MREIKEVTRENKIIREDLKKIKEGTKKWKY